MLFLSFQLSSQPVYTTPFAHLACHVQFYGRSTSRAWITFILSSILSMVFSWSISSGILPARPLILVFGGMICPCVLGSPTSEDVFICIYITRSVLGYETPKISCSSSYQRDYTEFNFLVPALRPEDMLDSL